MKLFLLEYHAQNNLDKVHLQTSQDVIFQDHFHIELLFLINILDLKDLSITIHFFFKIKLNIQFCSLHIFYQQFYGFLIL